MGEKIKGYFRKLFKILRKPEMAILPGNIAFYLILAIIPLLTVIVLLANSFGISINFVADFIKGLMPSQVSGVVIDVISGKGFDNKVGLFNIMAFILASNGTYAIITTSNALYKIKDRDWLKDRISSFILLILIIILFVFLIVVPIFGDNILYLMSKAKILENYIDDFRIVFSFIKWPLTLFIIYINIKLIYTIAPSKNIISSETTYGAIFTTTMWAMATLVFKFYLTYFARYDILYGNLSSMIILMVWIYFLSYIFVFGMAINVSRREEQELIKFQQKIEEELLAKKKLKEEKKKNKKKKVKKNKNIEEVNKTKDIVNSTDELEDKEKKDNDNIVSKSNENDIEDKNNSQDK